MAKKTTHFGRAGEYFAMSELLLRGWNVAVPVVDVGDDVFVIDDRDKATRRVQVKTAEPANANDPALPSAGPLRFVFSLSRKQLRFPHEIELFYMLMMRIATRWRFLVIPRKDLLEIRYAYLENARTRLGPGQRPLADGNATTDSLRLDVEMNGDEATGWNTSLSKYLDQWPDALSIVPDASGSIEGSSTPAVTDSCAGDPDPSPDPGT